MNERYDIAIVGSGPAGLSAAINGKIRNKKVIVFGQQILSNKLVKAPVVNNYLGFYDITGVALKDNFQRHLDRIGIKITLERINSVYAMKEYFALMVNNKTYEATTVILATGMEFTKPLEGEIEFLGRGVGYCATCDAPLYKGKIVTVIGYNKEAEEEANYVSELASKLYYIPMYSDNYELQSEIETISRNPRKIIGTDRVEKLILKDKEILTDAVFILKDSVAPNQLVPGIDMDGSHIIVNRKMETNLKGLYAAGDCIGRPYQYIKAAGEGQVAVLNAINYINNIK